MERARPRERGARAGRRRRRFAWVAVFPVLAVLLGSGLIVLQSNMLREPDCWVLPNARVLIPPGDTRCPLQPHEQIRRVELSGGASIPVANSRVIRNALAEADASLRVAVLRGGREKWVEIPVREVPRSARAARLATAALGAGALLLIPLFLLWHSPSRAGVPLALFYSGVAVVAVTVISGRSSEWLTRAALLAMIAAPAVLAHLSLTFPRERRVIREAPEILVIPYALGALLVPIGWFALERNPLLWPTFMMVLFALTAGGWLILILSCAFAIRESKSAVERARARLLCFGALVLPVIPMLLLGRDSEGAAQTATAYLWSSAVVIPLPIGLAISRYNLFNLGWDVRRWVGRLVYLGAAALIVTLVLEAAFRLAGVSHPLHDPVLIALVSFACIAAVELLRERMLEFVEARIAPRLERLRRLREQYEREMAQLREEDAVACRLGEVLRQALAPRAGCVFLSVGREWRPAYAFGADAPARVALIPHALAALGDRSLVQLTRAPEEEDAPSQLLDVEQIELVAAVEGGGERFGLLLLTGNKGRSPYTGVDLDFAGMATSQAGIALRNVRLTEELLAAERSVTTGRIARELAHDLGKELDWVSRLVRRLPSRLDDRERLTRDIGMIQEFTDAVTAGLRDFVAKTTGPSPDAPGIRSFDDMMEGAVRRMTRIHGPDRVAQSIDPALRSLRHHENLGRVVANLLDNALHAMPGLEPVHLFATLEDGWLRLVVQDRGIGISEEVLTDAFRPGFSTRSEEGGLGIGLSVSREIVEALGGTIELTPDPRGGTRATVRVPAAEQEQTCS
jgi:signal transduction histidine kinase